MKNSLLRLKNIAFAAGIILLMAGAARADLVYSTDFSAGYTASGSGAFVFGGATPGVTATQWFGSTNGLSNSGDLTFSNTTENRYRGAGVWLDTTGWATGLVTVGVEVSGYTAGDGSSVIFQTFAANGVDSLNSVSLDLHGGADHDGDPQVVAGTPTVALFGTEQNISGVATQDFTFTYNGTDPLIGLVFAINNDASVTTFEAATLDNLTVNTTAVPEPSSLAIVAADRVPTSSP
ncbi:MAG: hypothetical protein WBD31_09570 [Rubripirellula sp.]